MNRSTTLLCSYAAIGVIVFSGCDWAADSQRPSTNQTKSDTVEAIDAAPECPTNARDIREAVREGRISIEVDGQELTEDEEVAMASAFCSLLRQAIGEAVKDGVKKTLEKLEISDEIETKLIVEGLNDVDNKALVSVYLFTNGDESKPPTTIELTVEGKPFIRLCRIHAPLRQPYAVVTETRSVDSKSEITETVLVYNSASGWISKETTIVKRDLEGDSQ
jgi:hypothetical protein